MSMDTKIKLNIYCTIHSHTNNTPKDERLVDPPSRHPPPGHHRLGTPMIHVQLPNEDELAPRAAVERGIPDSVKSSFMDDREARIKEGLKSIPGRRPSPEVFIQTIHKTGVQMRERAVELEAAQDRQEDLKRQTRASAAKLITERESRLPFTVEEVEWSWKPKLDLTPDGLVPTRKKQTARKSTGGRASHKHSSSK